MSLHRLASWVARSVFVLERRWRARGLSALLLLVVAAPAMADAWQQLIVPGPQPTPRRQEGLIVDSRRNRLIMAGGEYGGAGTYALDLSNPSLWSVYNSVVPAELEDVVRAVHDEVGDQMLMLGYSMTVYRMDLSTLAGWSALPTQGAPPPPRSYPTVVMDALRHRMLVFGGLGPYSDVYALDLDTTPATWEPLAPQNAGPSPIWAGVGVYDAPRDRFVVATGNGSSTNQVWALSLATNTWTQLVAQGPAPSPRYLSAAAYDAGSEALVLFGGYDGNGRNDVWELKLTDPVTWTQQIPTSLLPSPRWSHVLTVNPLTGEFYTTGGWSDVGFKSDLWIYSRTDPVGPPFISQFLPKGGREGDTVTLTGVRFVGTTRVTIGGIESEILSIFPSTLRVRVPVGATTGPIVVETPAGTGTSSEDFVVGRDPVLLSVEPDSARAGETVTLRGTGLRYPQAVVIGGSGSASFTEVSDSVLLVTVDSLAHTGPIRVRTIVGESTSSFEFIVVGDDPRPRLLSVRDVRGDQGGKVVLRWRASDFDQPRYRRVRGYRVWRRAPADAPSGAVPGTALPAAARQIPGIADPEVFWESIAEVPAASLRGYAYTASTPRDSSASGNPYTAFFVQTLTLDPFEFFASSPDSGYSVDDLAPPSPGQFVVQYGTSSNRLHWTGREVADLAGYEVHRSTQFDFVPSEATRIAVVRDSQYVDAAGSYSYKLAAVDLHGNRSRFLSVTPDRPVATLISVASIVRRAGIAEILWYTSGNPGMIAIVERRTDDLPWQPRDVVMADGQGYLRFRDDGVRDELAYDYRLRIEESGEVIYLAEVNLAPLGISLAQAITVPNPAPSGRIPLQFAGVPGWSWTVQLFDVTGRKVEQREVSSADGNVSLVLGSTRRIKAGVYLLRLSGGERSVVRRVVVLD